MSVDFRFLLLTGASFFLGLLTLQQTVGPETGGPVPPARSPQERLAALSAADLEKIRNRRQRIDQLPDAARQRLRDIHAEWQNHPQREQMLATMQSYYEWWKTLSESERTRIKAEPLEQRLEMIRRIRQRQAEKIFGFAGETQLPPEDISALFEWNNDFLRRKRAQIIELYLASGQPLGSRRSIERLQNSDRPEPLFFVLDRIPDQQAEQLIGESDVAALKSRLSGEAVQIIESQPDESARQKLIYRWLVSAVTAQWNPPVPDRELMDFYDLEMTPADRRRVDALSPDRRRAAIASMYRSHLRRSGSLPYPFGRPPGGGRPSGKRGPPQGSGGQAKPDRQPP